MKETLNINNFKQYAEMKESAKDKREIVIFKYSPFCGVSRSVERVFDRWFEKLPESADLVCLKVDVVSSRSLSREIADDLGVKHESPQAIWVDKDLNVKWHDSHYEIDAGILNEQITK